MALADLVRTLERDATEQVRALLEAAAVQTAQREADAARRRSEEATHALQAWAEECRARAEERRASAQQAARADVLAARAEMLDRVRTALLAQVPAHASRVGATFARAAIACAGPREGVLRCPPALLDTATALAPASLRVEAADVGCGVVIELASGTQLVATLEALADREWPRLAGAIVALGAAEDAS
jgi:vacuolar-type H+-ATPase subunit E/Vma4